MSAITIDEIERDVMGCIHRVKAGETLVILQQDEPIAELKPVSTLVHSQQPAGLCAGEFRVPDDFNAPLPEYILRQFEEH